MTDLPPHNLRLVLVTVGATSAASQRDGTSVSGASNVALHVKHATVFCSPAPVPLLAAGGTI